MLLYLERVSSSPSSFLVLDPSQTMGKPIIQHQAVGTILAEMAINVEAARALVWKSAWIKDSGGRNTYYSSMAKALASKCAVENANQAVQVGCSHPSSLLASEHELNLMFLHLQIFGGAGFNTEYPVEKLYVRSLSLSSSSFS